MINIVLNGKKVKAEAGKTILEVAEEHGYKIPTLCHDKELKPFGSCWVCAVKVENRRGFVTSCGTNIIEGMVIDTESDEVRKARKMALELLLSDHYADCIAPCEVACPDKVDVQTYVSLIANGQYHEAVEVIKEKLPMPLSIGRVCPAFCESECRRSLVDDPLAIRQLKRFAADFDINDSWSYMPPKAKKKGKKIAIVGGGPSGLTCGYYLSNEGYSVTVFESAKAAGGWLRYGIPEYRLPKKILDKEIKLMCKNGMKIKTNTSIGNDITLSQLSDNFDAVYLAVGAQNAVPMRTKGSDHKRCFLGVDYLKDFVLGKKPRIGKKVAIVGGGNTAIDCARTAKRNGADVTLVYRRTRNEMPAEAYEVDAAEEEGIKFYFLTNPVEITGKKTKLSSIKFEKMKLGEPDSSGRRRPEPTGEFFDENFDSLIAAISQAPDVDFLSKEDNKIKGKKIPLTRWSTAIVDESTMHIGIENIFAGGDFRRGPATAIEAIADGRIAAQSINRFLSGKMLIDPVTLYNSKKEQKLKDVDPTQYKQYKRVDRFAMPELDPDNRAKSFEEVEIGFSEEDAQAEAKRCLECGCQINETCKLREYAIEYGVDPSLFFGEKNQHPIDHSHPFIQLDANKCIKCGRCVRICAETQGPGVLGYMFRGFSNYVGPEFGESLTMTTCQACGKCIEVCPVGALLPKNINYKLNPHPTEIVYQNCGLCATGCEIKVNVKTDKVTVIEPAGENSFNDRNLCFFGKFGWQMHENKERIKEAFIHDEESLEKNGISWHKVENKDELYQTIKEKLMNSKSRKIYISPTSTNEEILAMKTVAKNIDADISSLSYEKTFVDTLANTSLFTKTYKDIEEAESIVLVGKISRVLKSLCRSEQRKGKRLIIITNENKDFNEFADNLYNEDPVAETLNKILEHYYEEEDDSEESTTVNKEEKIDPIKLELPPKTLFIYNRDYITEETVWNIWMLSSIICDFKKGSGVLNTSHFSNFKGLRKFDIQSGKPEKSDFAIFYGELPCEEQKKILKNCKYLISINTHIDESDPSHVIFPAPSYLEIEGTSITNDFRVAKFKNPKKSQIWPNLLKTFQDLGFLNAKESSPKYWIKEVVKTLKKKPVIKEMTDHQLLDFLSNVEKVKFELPKQHNVQKVQLDKMKRLTKHIDEEFS